MTTSTHYLERPPRHAALSAWVPCGWVRQGPPRAADPVLIVPDGCLDLVWSGSGLQLVGPDSAPRHSPMAANATLAGVRLGPGAGRLLLGEIPATEVLNRQIDLSEIWGPDADRLTEAAAGTADAWQVASLLERALASRLTEHPPDRLVVAAAQALDVPRPPSITDLAAAVNVSPRQLRRRVTAALGYGPKTLQQVLRFQRVRRASPGADWARLAAREGYSDQPHLVREVRRYSGSTPTQTASSH